MAPPAAGPPGPPAPPLDEKSSAEENLNKVKKLIADLERKGLDLTEAKGWMDQADEMFRGGLFRTSLIYSGYASDVANEIFERIKSMLVKISKVKARAVDMLGKDHRDMTAIEELVDKMKEAINEGRLDDCQESINNADDIMRGSSTPYGATSSMSVATVAPSRGYSSCPSCGNIVDSSWKECRYCGSSLVDKEEVGSSGPAWTKTSSGPLMVSGDGFMDSEKEDTGPEEGPVTEKTATDSELSEDIKEMEKVEEDMAKVAKDLEGDKGEEKAEDHEGERIEAVEKKAEDEPGEEAKCPNCGEEIEADFVKCPICKTALN